MKIALTALFTVLLLSSTKQVFAQETRYISDQIYVPLRSGNGNQYRIINRGLPSGTKLLLLEEDGEWSRVKTEKGIEGWVPNHYLQNEPVAKSKLAQAEEKIVELLDLNEQLESQLNQIQAQNQELDTTASNSQTQAQQLRDELIQIKQISADAIELHQRHQALLKQQQLLQTEIDVLEAENERLENKSLHTWFLYGAGAVLLGVLIAVIVPRLRPRKRHSEWA
ncbi:MAG: TIGR04211 family SH3 domain-containing protein [Exilibacterium sp.]